jgi:hypothetical protein
MHQQVLAVVAEDERTDRPRARTQATAAGAIALGCPACGAPLSLTTGDQVQVCQYCRNACLVPHRSLLRALSVPPTKAVWWILFQGPSKLREELQAPPPAPALLNGVTGAPNAKIQMLRLKLSQKTGEIEATGFYPAPEAPGFNVLQLLFTTLLALIALGIGYFLYVLVIA